MATQSPGGFKPGDYCFNENHGSEMWLRKPLPALGKEDLCPEQSQRWLSDSPPGELLIRTVLYIHQPMQMVS